MNKAAPGHKDRSFAIMLALAAAWNIGSTLLSPSAEGVFKWGTLLVGLVLAFLAARSFTR
jgi:hypothetical protein